MGQVQGPYLQPIWFMATEELHSDHVEDIACSQFPLGPALASPAQQANEALQKASYVAKKSNILCLYHGLSEEVDFYEQASVKTWMKWKGSDICTKHFVTLKERR